MKKGLSAKDTAPPSEEMMIATTAMTVRPLNAFPAGFTLDTLRQRDTVQNFSAEYYFPVPPTSGFPKLASVIHDSMRAASNWYRPYPDEQILSGGYEAWLSSFFLTDSLLSLCFTEQAYIHGAANYNAGYFTLNWDRRNARARALTDFFHLPDDSTRHRFARTFNGARTAGDTNTTIEPDELHAQRDFYLHDGQLFLCFDEHEKAPFLTYVGVKLEVMRAFLR
ncbi:MAG: hypothetical protein AAF570_12270 [Bacteroidota bacterium]